MQNACAWHAPTANALTPARDQVSKAFTGLSDYNYTVRCASEHVVFALRDESAVTYALCGP